MLHRHTHRPSGRSIHDFRHQTQHYALDRDEHISKANKALNEIMTPSRISRAALSTCQRRVEELQVGLAKLRKENEKSAWYLGISSMFSDGYG